MYPAMKSPLSFIAALLIVACQHSPVTMSAKQSADAPFDIVLLGGRVVDGLGNLAFRADIGIKDDRIAAISTEALDVDDVRTIIDVTGLVVAPGFIDSHAHVQTTIHQHPFAENFVRQGITTLIASIHSQDQPWPLHEYASALEFAPNIGFLAGHNWIRKQVLGLENRAPEDEELDAMRGYVDATMRQGALGFSTGLAYVPATYATTEEVIELSKVAARHGGIYVTHMRNEGRGLIDSVEETIKIAKAAGIPAQINHHKVMGVGQWGWSTQTLALIDVARKAGIDITHDLYPYAASSTFSAALFPAWSLAGGAKKFAERIADPVQRSVIKQEMREILLKERTGNDLNRIQIRVLPFDESYNGRTLADMAEDRGLPNNVESGIDLAIELQLKGGFLAIFHVMDEDDVVRIMTHPTAMIESDGDLVSYGVGHPHPRSYGAFPRVIARYVNELGVLTLEEAIMKMTSMPAGQYNQPERGRVVEGAHADLVVFDAKKIRDQATYTNPHRYPIGIAHVIINGKFVLMSGALTGEKPGRWIKGPARRNLLGGVTR